jgi:transposase
MYIDFERWRVYCLRCRSVFVERLDWLAANPRYTKRFALHVGELCREMTVATVAQRERLHHSTVRELDRLYMEQQLAKAGLPAPRIIGVDEISIRKGHTYRIVVSDIERGRPIWVGGSGRTEKDLDLFFAHLGPAKTRRIKQAVMDMWKAFRNSVTKHVPGVFIVYDKFHIIRHLNDALDEVRRSEYRRLVGKDRSYIKGTRYTLLTKRKNLLLTGRQALRKLFKANKRLYVAYTLKETFDQLWDFKTPGGARRFFERWRESLKWQRLRAYEKFAKMIDRHWDGIVSYCDPANKCSLGMVEGLNTKIRVLQRRAYGYHDEEFLKLKILAAFLPPLGREALK